MRPAYCFFCTRPLTAYSIARVKTELSHDIYVYVCDECLAKHSDLILDVVKRGEKAADLPDRSDRHATRGKAHVRGAHDNRQHGRGKGGKP